MAPSIDGLAATTVAGVGVAREIAATATAIGTAEIEAPAATEIVVIESGAGKNAVTGRDLEEFPLQL